MDKAKIKQFLSNHSGKRERTIVMVDFSNVEKWKESLGWTVGVAELSKLIKNFSTGQKYLRRFYYGADYGSSEQSTLLTPWSKLILEKAEASGLSVVGKRVKYMHSQDGYVKKCDMDVEMAIDLVKERDNYDTVILFSGDGDLSYALKYLKSEFGKECILLGARHHIGREMIDAEQSGVISKILYADDFEYRLHLAGKYYR